MKNGPAELDLSVVIPTLNERENLAELFGSLRAVLPSVTPSHEIWVADSGSSDGTAALARSLGAQVVAVEKRGYGRALREAFRQCRGAYILTLDADLSHDPAVIRDLWARREEADLVIASRYVEGGAAVMPRSRLILSRILNRVFTRALDLPFQDISSGYRLYRRRVVEALRLEAEGFEFLEEILLQIHILGWRVVEVPFRYTPRKGGRSKVALVRFAWNYLRSLLRMWRLRNSVFAADYDARAYDSFIPLQRYWQRRRFRIIHGMVDRGGRILDVGCGSSRILAELPGAVGLDIQLSKLRWMRRYANPLLRADLSRLPFSDGSFGCLICSQVIEHIPKEAIRLGELGRVVRHGGTLILGTPDYGRIYWPVIEWFYTRVHPGGYGAEHVGRYTKAELFGLLAGMGFQVERAAYICGGELIILARKGASP